MSVRSKIRLKMMPLARGEKPPKKKTDKERKEA